MKDVRIKHRLVPSRPSVDASERIGYDPDPVIIQRI
jgi:hypothetical protein